MILGHLFILLTIMLQRISKIADCVRDVLHEMLVPLWLPAVWWRTTGRCRWRRLRNRFVGLNQAMLRQPCSPHTFIELQLQVYVLPYYILICHHLSITELVEIRFMLAWLCEIMQHFFVHTIHISPSYPFVFSTMSLDVFSQVDWCL